MSSDIEVRYFRLSLIWVETVLDLLAGRESSAPLAFLGRPHYYKPRFEEALQQGDTHLGLQPPWPSPSGQLFWTYYLEGMRPGDIDGKRAWKSLVPFRRLLPEAKVEAPWLPGYLRFEVFFYPHDTALVATATCNAAMFLDEVVDQGFKVRRTEKFDVRLANKDLSLSLDALADELHGLVRAFALGPGISPGKRSVTPFTVFSVIKGAGVDQATPTPEQGEVHRMLEAATTWRPDYAFSRLPTFDEASIQLRSTAPPSHLVYGRTRGRAVWFPGLFTQQDENLHSLACYHRNLTLASLQVESLGGLVSETARKLRSGQEIPLNQQECARLAGGILGRLYGADCQAYRSFSLRTQIEQNNLVEDINAVRDDAGMSALS